MPRPRGRKNNATLLKEAEVAKCLKLCQGHAALEAPAIVIAMAERAKQGDVQAAKLILDRVYPAMRQVDDRSSGTQGITINITSANPLEAHHGKTIDQEVSDADPGPADPAERQGPAENQGLRVISQGGGEAG